jgi:hypothetical protein
MSLSQFSRILQQYATESFQSESVLKIMHIGIYSKMNCGNSQHCVYSNLLRCWLAILQLLFDPPLRPFAGHSIPVLNYDSCVSLAFKLPVADNLWRRACQVCWEASQPPSCYSVKRQRTIDVRSCSPCLWHTDSESLLSSIVVGVGRRWSCDMTDDWLTDWLTGASPHTSAPAVRPTKSIRYV